MPNSYFSTDQAVGLLALDISETSNDLTEVSRENGSYSELTLEEKELFDPSKRTLASANILKSIESGITTLSLPVINILSQILEDKSIEISTRFNAVQILSIASENHPLIMITLDKNLDDLDKNLDNKSLDLYKIIMNRFIKSGYHFHNIHAIEKALFIPELKQFALYVINSAALHKNPIKLQEATIEHLNKLLEAIDGSRDVTLSIFAKRSEDLVTNLDAIHKILLSATNNNTKVWVYQILKNIANAKQAIPNLILDELSRVSSNTNDMLQTREYLLDILERQITDNSDITGFGGFDSLSGNLQDEYQIIVGKSLKILRISLERRAKLSSNVIENLVESSTTLLQDKKTRLDIAYCLGFIAQLEQDFNTKSKYGFKEEISSILELYIKDQISGDNSVVFALRHILENNNTIIISESGIKDLIDILNNPLVSVLIKRNSLWTIVHHIHNGKVGLLEDSVLEVLSLSLGNQDKEINKASIFALKYYFQYSCQVPKPNLLDSLVNISEEMADLTIEALYKITVLLYQESAGNKLPSKMLDLLGWLLIEHPNPEIRKFSFDIVKLASENEILPQDLLNIIEIEKQSSKICSKESTIQALSEILRLVQSGSKITRNCFTCLEDLIKSVKNITLKGDEEQKLALIIIESALRNDQDLPTSLIDTICYSLLNNKGNVELISVLKTVVQKTSCSNHKMVDAFEAVLTSLQEPSDAKSIEYATYSLKLLSQRGNILSKNGVEWLIKLISNLVEDGDSEVSLQITINSLECINNSLENHQYQSLPATSIKVVLKLLSHSNSLIKILASRIGLTLCKQGIRLDVSDQELLVKILTMELKGELEANILAMISCVAKCETTNETTRVLDSTVGKMANLISYTIKLSDNNLGIEEKITAAQKIYELVQTQSFNSLPQNVVNSLKQALHYKDLRNIVLATIGIIVKEGNSNAEFLSLSDIELISDSLLDLAIAEIALSILEKLVLAKTDLPIATLTDLTDFLENSLDHALKYRATKILEINSSNQKKELTSYTNGQIGVAVNEQNINSDRERNKDRTIWTKAELEQYFPSIIVPSSLISEIVSKTAASNLDIELQDKLFSKSSSIANIEQIRLIIDILDFIVKYAIPAELVSKQLNQVDNLIDLRSALSKEVLNNLVSSKFWHSGAKFVQEISKELGKLLDLGWQLDSLSQLLETDKVEEKLLLDAIRIINSYKLTEDAVDTNGKSAWSILTLQEAINWNTDLSKLAIAINLKEEGKEKDLSSFLSDLTSLNQHNQQLLDSLIGNELLKTKFTETITTYNSDSSLTPLGKNISEWEQENIQYWSNELLTKYPSKALDDNFLPEMIAIVKRATIIDTNNDPRLAQILSILMLLLHQGDKGRLIQVSTGEGKSTTSAMLAVILALRGEKVDIITSSPILAKRDAVEWQEFFAMFNLVADHNIGDEKIRGYKKCYAANIVYGDVGSFQYDLLKDEYKGYGTRGDRPFNSVIIDEVDSMLIDESGKLARLASHIAGTEYLEALLAAGWYELERLDRHLVYLEEGCVFLIRGDFSYENGKLILFKDSDGKEPEVDQIENARLFRQEHIENYLKQVIEKKLVCIPEHLKEFAVSQIENWAESAIKAKNMAENKNYIIIKDQSGHDVIAPVDYHNTGIVQERTSWQHGLHQFLQLKHGLKLTAENFTTSFISNMGFFLRYGSKVYGMTGTLGSNDSQDLLTSIYPIDLAFVPTYKQKQFIELLGILSEGEEQWLENITHNIKEEAGKKRAVLVICETISAVQKVKEALVRSGYPPNKIKLYSRSDNDEHLAIGNSIDSGEVIIATNLAGRGTDLKTTKNVEDNGGLHVCVTFLPDNLRIEEQAFGRTARQGKKGTAQLITDHSEIVLKLGEDSYYVDNISDLKELRNLAEHQRMQQVKNHEVSNIHRDDLLFSEFCKFTNELRSKENHLDKLSQLEELWGIKLKQIQEESARRQRTSSVTQAELQEYALKELRNFKELMVKQYFDGYTIMRNPAYLIREGFNKMGVGNRYAESIDLFTKAINLDDVYSFAAYYNRAYAKISQGYALSMQKGKHDASWQESAYSDLMMAKSQIETFIIPELETMQILSSHRPDSAFTKQIITKINLLKLQLDYIDSAINTIKNCAKGDITKILNHSLLSEL
ncbi:helicase-related protein [Candidatus Tisiphia endosymbiont of Piscicola geometra]|uniref:preprotein translocase subunit SecA n=1 Tax=Candidatus Tisiphia endosymbiont of Piscicola geometra TaxID=3066273 RepID=UPI00312C8FEE